MKKYRTKKTGIYVIVEISHNGAPFDPVKSDDKANVFTCIFTDIFHAGEYVMFANAYSHEDIPKMKEISEKSEACIAQICLDKYGPTLRQPRNPGYATEQQPL